MNGDADLVAAQQRALLAYLDERHKQECARLLREARHQSAALRARAWREARDRVASAVEAERQSIESLRRDIQARLATARRLRQQQLDVQRIARGREYLEAVLRRRWQQPDSARAWCRRAMRQALAQIASTEWALAHAPGAGVDVGAEARQIAAAERRELVCAEQPELGAGLILRGAGVVVDASLGALLHRPDVEARLLAHAGGDARGPRPVETGSS